MTLQLESAIAKLEEKAKALGQAIVQEQNLEDDRAAIKADAIVRVMERDGVAATRAEKVVETDEQYFLHREKQRAAIVARYKADAEYWAAKCEATQASLITPDVLALESEINEVAEANRSLFLSRNETREANAELVQANRELAEQLLAANETINASRFTHHGAITMNLTPINAEATP